MISGTKHPANYEAERTESSELEQKPIKNFNEFSDREEEELRQQAQKRRQLKREQSQENKAKKTKVKTRRS